METLVHSAHPLALRRSLCNSCFRAWRNGGSPLRNAGLQNSDRLQRRYKGYIARAGDQAKPIDGFYAELLSRPMKKITPATRTDPEPPPPESLPKTEKEELLQKARVVFGSRLAGPGERRAEIEAKSRNIAGIMVPPRPTEPDNCCMSGCVNCVWDMYRDEMEEWAAKSAEARAVQAKVRASRATQKMSSAPAAASMEEDGGGSDTNWESGGQGNLFDDIPVGIREFMKTEKKLKQRHMAEQAISS
ncbi:oxidoreductase-like protein [Dendryphion nanum]|uniref:Oxidoreductase-like protein n=1 Tax=Dendryphion nanum TaxID=256645 RepID=A0A9P9EKM8_9PLEO|nr:oxidoreductase-like protein [Dendryphion nanum]